MEQGSVHQNTISITDKEDIKHIVKVLRLGIGDKLDISDSAEFEYETEIISLDNGEVELKILDKQRFTREPKVRLTLFQGIPKQGKMELIIQKSVELGVHAIIPVFTHRTVVQDKGGFQNKIQRWQKVSDEAVKQCKRGIIPQIADSVTFREALESLKDFDLILFPYENEEAFTMKDCLRGLPSTPEKVAIIIGPEGGFSDQEAALLKELRSQCVTLGKTILRTETAGIVAMAMVLYELEL